MVVAVISGEQVRQLRESRGLQQKFVADAAGLSKQQLSQIESGKRQIEVNEYVAIMTAMNYKAGDFLPNSLGDDVAQFLPHIEQLRRIDASELPAIREQLEHVANMLARVAARAQAESPKRARSADTDERPTLRVSQLNPSPTKR